MSQTNHFNRIYGLDALRALLFIGIICIHAANTYGAHVYEKMWPMHDNNANSIFFNYLSNFLQATTIPLFFLISGYFSAMVYRNKGVEIMVKSRIRRVLVPFILSILLIYPLVSLSVALSTDIFHGQGFSFELLKLKTKAFSFFPIDTGHLWFLYYLIVITFIGVLVVFAIEKTPFMKKLVKKVIQTLKKYKVLVFILLVLISSTFFSMFGVLYAPTPRTLGFHKSVVMYYSLFYMYGWGLFYTYPNLKDVTKNRIVILIAGFALYAFKIIFAEHLNRYLFILIETTYVWCLVHSTIGIFVTYFNKSNRAINYFSESSMWVYLIHMPIVAIIPALLSPLAINVFLKFILTVSITLIISIISYEVFVKKTFVGVLFLGKKKK